MAPHTLAVYVLIAWLSILTPGPAVLLSVTNAISHGPRSSVASTLGNVSGLLVLASASVLGLGVLLRASAVVFTVLKMVGATYLLYLGYKQIRARPAALSGERGAQRTDKADSWALYREGVLISVTNPKPILFFSALFPQFINTAQPLVPQFIVLTAIFTALSFVTLVAYAYLAHSFKDLLHRPRLLQWIRRTCGLIFIGFGASLLALRAPLAR